MDTFVIQEWTMTYYDGNPLWDATGVEIQPGGVPARDGDDLILPRCLVTKVIGVEKAALLGRYVKVRIKPDGTAEVTVSEDR